MNLPRCGCGRFHLVGARWCVWCGAQPPTRRRNRIVNAFSAQEQEAMLAATVALGEALVATGGKWGVA